MDDLVPALTALSEFRAELERKLAAAGVEGVQGALDLYQRLKVLLDDIPSAKIEGMLDRIGAVERAIRELERAVQAVRRLKETLAG